MRITHLSVEGPYGEYSLRVAQVPPGLSFYHSPQEPGGCFSRLVHAALFGHISQFGPSASHAGTLGVATDGGQYTLHRDRQGAVRYQYDSAAGPPCAAHAGPTEMLQTKIPASVFERAFAVDFARRGTVESLLAESDVNHLLDTAECNVHGATNANPCCWRSAPGDQHVAELDQLVQRRNHISDRLESCLVEARSESAACEARLRETADEIQQKRATAAALRGQLHAIDIEVTELATQQNLANDALGYADGGSSACGTTTAELDAQIKMWQKCIADLERRREELDQRLTSESPHTPAEGLQDPSVSLEIVRRMLDEIDSVLTRLQHSGQGTCACLEAHTRLAPAAKTMREHLQIVSRASLRERRCATYEEQSAEARNVERCLADLRNYVSLVTRHRQRHQDLTFVPVQATTRSDLMCRRQECERLLQATEQSIQELRAQQSAWEHQRADYESDSEIAELQRQFADVNAALRRARDRSSSHSGTAQTRLPLLDHASHWLARLTAGELPQLHLSAEQRTLFVTDRSGHSSWLEQLSTAQQDLVYLSLCLAIADDYHRRGVEAPLVLESLYCHLDEMQIAQTASALSEYGRGGKQILVFTSSAAALTTLQNAGLNVQLVHHDVSKTLDASPMRTAPPPVPAAPAPSTAPRRPRFHEDEPMEWEAEWSSSQSDIDWMRHAVSAGDDTESYNESSRDDPTILRYTSEPNANTHDAEPVATHVDDTEESCPVSDPASTDTWFSLDLTHSASTIPLLPEKVRDGFAHLGIFTVQDLIEADAHAVAAGLADRGVKTKMVRIWQRQALLMSYVPELSANDARLLAIVGMQDPDALDQADADRLHASIGRFLQSPNGWRYRRDGREVRRDEVAGWIASARRGRRRWRASSIYRNRSTSSRGSRKNRGRHSETQASSRSSSSETGRARTRHTSHAKSRTARRRRRRNTGHRDRSYTRRSGEPRQRREVERERRRASDRESAETSRRPAAATEQDNTRGQTSIPREERQASHKRSETKLKFYLEPSSNVEAAPAIGPKTAERLEKIGIRTVADLLRADPEQAAKQLNYRRVKAETIRQWQHQSRLVCQIPQLRGHDAQILVACGIVDVDQLHGKDAGELFSVVGPFVDTKEGARIVRSGKKPDLDEVTDWIRWAGSSRMLDAA